MESIARGIIVYVFVLLLFRISGNRTLAQSTSFDLVLLLIISETIQEALVDGDHSMTNGLLLIVTLVGTSILLSCLKQVFPALDRWVDGVPVIIMDHGNLLSERMQKVRVNERDILESARRSHGIERLEQIKYAILERSGEISIIAASGGTRG
jgi:uncharacterized membrane protein YcaP (DUF421 family)